MTTLHDTGPLPIAAIAVPTTTGTLGLSMCPGLKIPGLGPMWDRDLGADVETIAAWGAAAVVTLTESAEMTRLGVSDLETTVRARGLDWHHLPIRDRQPPPADFDARWRAVAPRLHQVLRAGGKVLIHCKGGLGRSGTVAARLLVEFGEEPAAAIARVRDHCPGAVETQPQIDYVLRLTRPTG